MAPVEGCQVVRHQQEKLAAVQPHAPAPRRHWTIAGVNCSAFRNQASVDEDFLPEGTDFVARRRRRSEEHTSELQSLMRISYDVFCLKKKKNTHTNTKPKNKYTISNPTS